MTGKTKKAVALLTAIFLTVILISDSEHQQLFSEAEAAFEAFEEQEYQRAEPLLRHYLSAFPPESLHWVLVEWFNGEDSIYTFENAELALAECRKHTNRHT